MRKRMFRLLTLLLCAAMLTISAAGVNGGETESTWLSPKLLEGTLSRGADGLLKLTDKSGEKTIVHLSEATCIVNAETGTAVDLDNVKDGETVQVYVRPAMTLLPPAEAVAVLVLCKLPKGAPAPAYQQVTAVDAVDESGITVTIREGGKMTVTSSASIAPYRTKNVVTYRDLIPGTWFLTWIDGAAIDRVVLFPYDSLPFTDVAKDNWAYDEILGVTSKGLMRCDETLEFRPVDALTRAEMVQALYHMAGCPVVIQSMPDFTDVQSGGEYINALTWAVGNKLVSGYGDNTFRPDAPVTRQQMAVFLYRWEVHRGGGFQGAWMLLLDYPDRDSISDYAYKSIAWCTIDGILTGRSDGTLAPGTPVTRAAAAAMMQRYLDHQADAQSAS
ncbi:putative surface layer protein [Oscillibacter valericigenes Sjm18-20]|nr:putative surface layer protein [Oscillibacter valericigenes Sjm18-20]